jgi:hypothetical protein
MGSNTDRRPYTSDYSVILLQPTFVILKNIKVGLCDHHAVCVCMCIPSINFRIAEPIFMKLGMYIMAPEPISTAYFINSFRLCVCKCIPLIVARQRLSRHFLAATNTGNNRRIVGGVVFYVVRVVSKERRQLVLSRTSS